MSAAVLPARAAGVLLHPTSLPGPVIGDLGPEADRFATWLAEAGQSVWQILPLVPTDASGSPYSGLSAVAGDPLLLSPELLRAEGLLAETSPPADPDAEHVDYTAALAWKTRLLRDVWDAFARGGAAPHLTGPFADFRAREADWVEDFTLWMALREAHGGASWTQWPRPLRLREPAALRQAAAGLRDEISVHAFAQFLFERQWARLRERLRALGIRVLGDLPIFVAHDSADVWAHRELFELDEHGEPIAVSGVPPDYFSATGQRWGNPLYRWREMARDGYAWWVRRFRRLFAMVDVARIDHFRGFEAYWRIPAERETAVRGEWVKGPGEDFFRAIERQTGPLPLVAEDLGTITPEVEALREALGTPGMRVLQFAFDGGAANPHLPANYPPEAVAYTGTHDNDTARGWYDSAGADERAGLARLAGGSVGTEPHWAMAELVFRSAARLAILPMQDVLGLGGETRMNTPAEGDGNWRWRLAPAAPLAEAARRLRALTEATGRLPAVRGAPSPSTAA